MEFKIEELDEVASKEEGFLGSYFPAKSISHQRDESYMVECKTLLETDDESKPLVEKFNHDEVRTQPDYKLAIGLRVNNYADAYDNEGWWVGRIMQIVKGRYNVYFYISRVEVVYPFHMLSIHQEWRYNTWWTLLPITTSLSETADQRSASSVGCFDVRV